MLAKKLLNANISRLLMEGNGLSNVLFNSERRLNLPPKFYYNHLFSCWSIGKWYIWNKNSEALSKLSVNEENDHRLNIAYGSAMILL